MTFPAIPLEQIHTPAYVAEEARLIKNLEILARVQREARVKILLAIKGYTLWRTFPLAAKYLAGGAASGLHEARLIHEELPGECHTYSPSFTEKDFAEVLRYSDHIVFNSFTQFKKFRGQALAAGKKCGLRVNPEKSFANAERFNPCSPLSRFGVKREDFELTEMEGLTGIHMHALCEKFTAEFEQVLAAFEEKFADVLPRVEWVNLGGGQLVTDSDYDVAKLIEVVRGFRARHPNLQEVYFEFGQAVGWQIGPLVATAVDIVKNGENRIVLLDTSFIAHMPDTLNAPYTPAVRDAVKDEEWAEMTEEEKAEWPHAYILSGNTCMTGDFLARPFHFAHAIQPGEPVVLEDMLHYSSMQTNTFNGVQLPSFYLLHADGELELLKSYGYEEFKNRNS